MRVGGTLENTLKGSGIEKRGEETKILEKVGKLDQGVSALKMEDIWNLFTNYVSICYILSYR